MRELRVDMFSTVDGYANGTMLRLTLVERAVAAPYTVLGWNVVDIVSMTDQLTARGVLFTRYEGMGQDERGIWTAPGGAKIAWFLDPDGNNLSLTEFAAPPEALAAATLSRGTPAKRARIMRRWVGRGYAG